MSAASRAWRSLSNAGMDVIRAEARARLTIEPLVLVCDVAFAGASDAAAFAAVTAPASGSPAANVDAFWERFHAVDAWAIPYHAAVDRLPRSLALYSEDGWRVVRIVDDDGAP